MAEHRGILLGIDVGGTAVKAAARSPDGSVRLGASARYLRPDRQTLRAAIRDAVGSVVDAVPTRVGMCLPGRRAAAGDRIELAVNVPGLQDYAFREIVQDAIGDAVPFRVVSDAEAATRDAAMAHPQRQRVLGMAIGTGVGVALVEHGVPVRIGRGTIGHLGQIDIGPMPGTPSPGPLGPDGGRNSLEAFLGVHALTARFGHDLSAHLPNLSKDDPAILALVRAVRIGLAIYTPDLVLLLGGIGLAMGPRLAELDGMIRTDLTRVAPPGWTLAVGTSLHHAALGAASLAGEFSDKDSA